MGAGAASTQPATVCDEHARSGGDFAGVAVPLELLTNAGVLSLISTTTVFGTSVDITLSELALESFFPADDRTAERLREAAARRRNGERDVK